LNAAHMAAQAQACRPAQRATGHARACAWAP
jgi:hypothetical protein